MPDRIIRDEVLDSPRYLNLTSDSARLLFIHLMLVADDLGNAEAGPTFIRRRLLASPLADEAIAALLNELCDADLIRVYTVESKRFVHVPRFRQRLRIIKAKHPLPPDATTDSEFKELLCKMSDRSQTYAGHLPVTGQTDVGHLSAEEKRSEEKRSEEKGREEKKTKSKATPLPEGFTISDSVRQWAAEHRHHSLQFRFEHFVGYVRASGKTYVDWDAALMNAIRNNWAKLDAPVDANGKPPKKVAL